MKNRWTRLQVLLAAALVLLLCLGLAAGCASADGVYSICSGQASVNGTTETLGTCG